MAGLNRFFERASVAVTAWSGTTPATVLAFAFVLGWFLGGFVWFGFGDSYQMVVNTTTTIVTFLMVFLIQRAQNKDMLVVHTKLNELIAAQEKANNCLAGLEEAAEEDVRLAHDELIKKTVK